jgi:hypothetical protein
LLLNVTESPTSVEERELLMDEREGPTGLPEKVIPISVVVPSFAFPQPEDGLAVYPGIAPIAHG